MGEGRGRTEHGVEEEDVALGNVFGELGVEELCERSLLIALNQDLAYPDGAAQCERSVSGAASQR